MFRGARRCMLSETTETKQCRTKTECLKVTSIWSGCIVYRTERSEKTEKAIACSVTATSTIRNMSKSTQCHRKPRKRSKMMQARPNMMSVGIQCSLLVDSHKDASRVIDDHTAYDEFSRDCESHDSDVIDSDYVVSSSESSDQDTTIDISAIQENSYIQPSPDKEEKFIVFESKLFELFKWCPACFQVTTCAITKRVGTLVHIHQKCQFCGYVRNWHSQPYLGTMPAGNLLLSGAVLFSGCTISKVLRLFNILNICCYARSTFYRHQALFVQPIILTQWESHQQSLFTQLNDNKDNLIISGDCRSDSPGHCAKYGVYTILEQRINKVIDMQLVQSNEVKNSGWCELEGLKRCLSHLTANNLAVNTLITDRHRQIGKWLRDQQPDIKHLFDIWHIAKGIKHKLDCLSKVTQCKDVGLWKSSIVNHLYWCAGSTPNGDSNVIIAKWESILFHIINVHKGHPNALFRKCAHAELDDQGDNREWLEPNTKASTMLEQVLMRKMLVNDIGRISPTYQTSSLEAYHSLILHFAPKNTSFSYLGMKCRLFLAGMHYNENSHRLQRVRLDGELQYDVRFPKCKKGESVIRVVKTAPTCRYAYYLMKCLVEAYKSSPAELRDSLVEIRAAVPPPLAHSYEHPDKTQAVAAHVSRYNKYLT